MNAAALVLGFVMTAIPPLTHGQRARLETAHDGRDHREEAFVALTENARAFGGDLGDAAVRLQPDLGAMIETPDDYRGDLCRITGTLAQTTRLDRPFGDASEWFVRDAWDRPVLVYVVDSTGEEATPFAPGDRVSIIARFYKRVDATARDGEHHRYAAFVGARPRRLAARTRGLGAPGTVLLAGGLLLAGLATVLVALRMLTRRSPRHRRPAIPLDAPDRAPGGVDDGSPLPDDPAEALRELKRRAGHGA